MHTIFIDQCRNINTPSLPALFYITSVLWAKGAVVGAVAALLAEVDVGADAALQQPLGGPGVVTHAQEDLVGLILAEEAQGVHLRRRSGVVKDNRWRLSSFIGSSHLGQFERPPFKVGLSRNFYRNMRMFNVSGASLCERGYCVTVAVFQFRVCILWKPHLKANYVTMPHKGCPNSKAPPNAVHKRGLLFPLSGGCIAAILHSLTYPKILCMP